MSGGGRILVVDYVAENVRLSNSLQNGHEDLTARSYVSVP